MVHASLKIRMVDLLCMFAIYTILLYLYHNLQNPDGRCGS